MPLWQLFVVSYLVIGVLLSIRTSVRYVPDPSTLKPDPSDPARDQMEWIPVPLSPIARVVNGVLWLPIFAVAMWFIVKHKMRFRRP